LLIHTLLMRLEQAAPCDEGQQGEVVYWPRAEHAAGIYLTSLVNLLGSIGVLGINMAEQSVWVASQQAHNFIRLLLVLLESGTLLVAETPDTGDTGCDLLTALEQRRAEVLTLG
jgi:hypothetical protein